MASEYTIYTDDAQFLRPQETMILDPQIADAVTYLREKVKEDFGEETPVEIEELIDPGCADCTPKLYFLVYVDDDELDSFILRHYGQLSESVRGHVVVGLLIPGA